jgi:DNA-nicking Smr family endonuclease
MNRDGAGKPRPSRAGRQITEEEAELWHRLGRSLDKVKKKPRVSAHSDPAWGGEGDAAPGDACAPTSAVPERRGRRSERPPQRPAAAAQPSAFPPDRPAAPAEIDRRAHRQVAAGKVPIDAVLDLHGLNQEAAHGRLSGFLMSCQAKGHRMVLVITGKGGNAGRFDAGFDDWPAGAAPRGVLRRSVPLWLEDPELRAIVVGYAAAGARHGGEGALYIRLRKPREA